ncbi:Antihemorrhagic factor BJ46a Metalloproteinase inhibitor Precursor [Channa argus]|uniref:Antihemorrhagic factor BJ46a Metalloproteinase inhibitor n=2 Tax=Channa argus TaxID=215402 RepID=A0A6G1PN12_CHAAH|nr:Antihemorrhagic factor BJ46a Metalloproteinase inhibitor Precursor [Channa argus]
MKRLLLLVLLSSAVLLCCTAPAVGPVACTEDDIAPAAHLAMQHINKYHHHGYKFQLNQTLDHKLEKTDDGCNIELHLDLLETKCHVVNPTPFEDCPLREEHDQEVMADCKVDMTVKSGEAKVTEYLCDTKQVKSNQEMVSMCPDCPILIPLNSTEGLKSVREAVNKFNENTTHQHYYILKEVGRITSGYMMMAGMAYYAEFALVETFCPMGTRIVIEACQPKCPDRARHAFCTSSYTRTNGLGSVECEYYPPLNTTAHEAGEKETPCRHHHHGHDHHGHDHHDRHDRHGQQHHSHGKNHTQGPPPHSHNNGDGHRKKHNSHGKNHTQGPPPHAHDHGHGPPPHAHGQGPPPHAHDHGHGPPPHAHGQGPPPHAHDHGHGPPPHAHGQGPPPGHGRWPHHEFFRPCHGFLANADPALHPICPWPYPEPRHKPKLHLS